ncbi:hypothetical protein SAMN05444358_101877 [Ruegeria halocynthiae]|uniref:Uncharacterized protein n=1 Tax=Ruegeria halocynthiae TaxID=985054 RepID=A0A1H2TPD6_9RHOB|nr:hypothetical protein [Ruegeria halocynthiae]SDW45813.1 hypothetical protein SAMN05444358_101877 [Ruegeria halocynthiae]
MSQIEELQRRIIAAMERIGSGIEVLRDAGPAAGDDVALRVALEEERVANAQLEERLKTIKEKHAQEIDALRTQSAPDGEADTLRTQLAEATSRLATVEAARAELADAKAVLENSDEVATLKAEIETLQSYRGSAEEAESLRSEVEQLTPIAYRAEEMEAELSRLRADLVDSERLTELNAELKMLRAERASHGAAMSRLDDDLQRLRKANEQLRGSVDELRAAAEAGVADADMLNRATAAELEATRAARASDAAEAHAVLARLEPLLTHANLAEGEVE